MYIVWSVTLCLVLVQKTDQLSLFQVGKVRGKQKKVVADLSEKYCQLSSKYPLFIGWKRKNGEIAVFCCLAFLYTNQRLKMFTVFTVGAYMPSQTLIIKRISMFYMPTNNLLSKTVGIKFLWAVLAKASRLKMYQLCSMRQILQWAVNKKKNKRWG